MFWGSHYLILGLKIFGCIVGYFISALILLLVATAIDSWCTCRLEDRGIGILYVLGRIFVGLLLLYTLPMFIILDIAARPVDFILSDDETCFL